MTLAPTRPYDLEDQETPESPGKQEQIVLRQIINTLEELRENRTYAELSREIGISRPMLRMMDLYGIAPGVDTLATLLTWDSAIFAPLVLRYLLARGNTLRERNAHTD